MMLPGKGKGKGKVKGKEQRDNDRTAHKLWGVFNRLVGGWVKKLSVIPLRMTLSRKETFESREKI